MKKQFNKIELPQTLNQIFPIKVRFEDSEIVYDFGKHFDSDITRAFAKIFYEKASKLKFGSRESLFGSANKFFTYLKETNILSFTDLDRKHLSSFAIWLDNKDINVSTKYGLYQQIEVIFKELKKVKDLNLADFKIPANPFKKNKEDRVPPKTLSAEQIKKILSICYTEIDEIMKEFRVTQEKLQELDSYNYEFNRKDIYHVTHYFYKNYGYFPLLTELSIPERTHVKKIGGVDEINRRLCPNPATLLPFYLVLLIELAANSDAIRQIKVDCITEDPLFEDRCFINWDKARASKEQKRNVFKKKKYGAYQIIQCLKELTQHTRKQVTEKDKDFLFVIRGEYESNKLSVVIPKRFNDEVQKFIKKHQLDFTFAPSDIRPTVLTEIYRSRKDVVSVSKVANHKSINTTLLYIVNEETKKENREYLSEKQSTIFENIIKSNGNKESEDNEITILNAENLGFSCKKPIVDKKVCINWMAELTNPELIIPADPKYLSKIIALETSIKNAKHFMDKERFVLLYEPILNVIQDDILPKFTKIIIEESKILSKEIKIPLLEDY